MIYFDVTKSASSRHASGLMRVNRRLREELGEAVQPVEWGKWNPATASKSDWYLSTEVFDADQRTGFIEFLKESPCRTAAMFPDAIPLKFPEIIWPHSVARHPRYMHTLSLFDHVFGISEEVKHDLQGFWAWQGTPTNTALSVLPLGADFDGSPRRSPQLEVPAPLLVCVGIVEPRKNQSFLVDVAESMWAKGLAFELHIVGRVNPHFGKPIVQKIKAIAARNPQLQFHEAASDEVFSNLLNRARSVVFPTIAEGCGLPVLEALWRSLPCVCSDLPVLREITHDGGCLCIEPNNSEEWERGLTQILTDDVLWTKLANEASVRPLPTWSDSANEVRQQLR